MKEVMSIIRINKINETKRLLAENGFPAVTCRKVYGRGKKATDYSLIADIIDSSAPLMRETMETISESHRLIAKRMLIIVVNDADVDKVVRLIIEANRTNSMGDGKIFIMPVENAARVRTGETGEAAI